MMQKINIKIFMLLIFYCAFFSSVSHSQSYINTIVIDAGHGGKDPGAIGKKTYEKKIALAIALKLGKYIETKIKGVKVIYTRKTDVFIELFKRAEIANKNNAQVFISIHVNSSTNSKPTGTSTYVMGLNKSEENLDIAQRENAVILKEKSYKKNYNGFDPNAPESYIALSLLQHTYLEQSLLLAQKVQEQFKKRAGRKNLGVKQAGLVVLWNATMPAILVETGFISNSSEEKFLMSDNGQSIIASAIFRAFRDYKQTIEKNKRFIPESSNSNANALNKTNNKITTDTGVRFSVQLKSSTQQIPLKSKEFKGLTGVWEQKYLGIYKYYIAKTKSFNEILKTQTEVRKSIKDAFVVAFKNDKRISIKQAMKEIGRE